MPWHKYDCIEGLEDGPMALPDIPARVLDSQPQARSKPRDRSSSFHVSDAAYAERDFNILCMPSKFDRRPSLPKDFLVDAPVDFVGVPLRAAD